MNDIGMWIVYVGLGLAYLKTSEAMVPYAPRAIFGWQSTWISYIWAYLAGALVEGVLYVAYIKLRQQGKDRPTKLLSALVAIISIGFSITMNRIDQMVTDGVALTLASGSPLALLHNVVFLIPLFAALLFMVLSVVDANVNDRDPRGGGGRPKGHRVQDAPRHQPVGRWHGTDGPNLAARSERQALGAGLSDPGDEDDEAISVVGLAERARPQNGRSEFTSEQDRMPRLVAERHGH